MKDLGLYRGWHVTYDGTRPVTGTWRAERFGVGMCNNFMHGLLRMIDYKVTEKQMGTRSLTFVHEGDQPKPFMCMYCQYDGYPSGHGKELAEFLNLITMVNGIGRDDGTKIANGAGCLAAQIVAHFKDGPGGIYLMPSTTKDADQEYEYHVFADAFIGVKVKVYENQWKKPKKLIYEAGNMLAFLGWCVEEKEEALGKLAAGSSS